MFSTFHLNPATSEVTPSSKETPPPLYSYKSDCKHPHWNREWNSLDEFEEWKRGEEERHCIEFRIQETRKPAESSKHLYSWRREYRCGRRGTGSGGKKYEKKFPDRERKIETKRVSRQASRRVRTLGTRSYASFTYRQLEEGCPCTLTIKTYPDTKRVVGRYVDEHSHETGGSNVKYTRIPTHIRESIAQMLRNKVNPEHIVSPALFPAKNPKRPELTRQLAAGHHSRGRVRQSHFRFPREPRRQPQPIRDEGRYTSNRGRY